MNGGHGQIHALKQQDNQERACTRTVCVHVATRSQSAECAPSGPFALAFPNLQANLPSPTSLPAMRPAQRAPGAENLPRGIHRVQKARARRGQSTLCVLMASVRRTCSRVRDLMTEMTRRSVQIEICLVAERKSSWPLEARGHRWMSRTTKDEHIRKYVKRARASLQICAYRMFCYTCNVHVQMFICTHARMYVCVFVYASICVCMHMLSIRVCVCTCFCICACICVVHVCAHVFRGQSGQSHCL